jgi:D-3-phosphoglycerate dehydrogenase / 2-oxoglutarate reductase
VPEPRPIVVVADPIDPDALRRLALGPCEVIDASAGAAALAEHLPHAWGLIVRSRTKVTAELIGKAPELSVVARAGVGVDNVDLPAATARGIRVVNAPTAATESVAEITVAFMLMLVRDLFSQIQTTKSGRWERGGNRQELAGKEVGFLGYGRIAREVARKLTAFSVRSRAFDPFVKNTDDGTEMLDLETVLSSSDIVSVHAALTPENHHLLNAERIQRMRHGAYVVNVARGPLIDEAALLAALDSGQLGGAALDVFETEPPRDPRLLAHPKVLATPHIGAATHEAQARAGSQIVDEVLRALNSQPLQAWVNPPARS